MRSKSKSSQSQKHYLSHMSAEEYKFRNGHRNAGPDTAILKKMGTRARQDTHTHTHIFLLGIATKYRSQVFFTGKVFF